jgi:hypothetical protein
VPPAKYEVNMPSLVRRPRRGPIVLLTLMGMILSACSSGATIAIPSESSATGQPPTGLAGAATAFAHVDNYRFTMTLAGASYSAMLAMLPSASAVGNAPFTMGGTITINPQSGADIRMVGLHIIEIGGHDYMDVGGTGAFDQITIAGTRLADRFSPATMFSATIDPSTVGGYDLVGTESKNGVPTDHYQASNAALETLGAMSGIAGAAWSADVWIARGGGYPVSMAIVAVASDKSIVREVLFDITNVGDPTNSVKVPANVTGA